MIANVAERSAIDNDGDNLTTNVAAEVVVDVDADTLNLLSSLKYAALLKEGKDGSLAHELYEVAVQ